MSSRILITGGAGFIGSNLANRLVAEDRDVMILDTLSPQIHGPDPWESPLVRNLDSRVALTVGSVVSRDDLQIVRDGYDTVVHLAAETGTGQSMYEIDRYVETNIGGTGKLMDLLANEDHAVEKIVVASSRSVYGEGRYRAASGAYAYPEARSSTNLAAGLFDPLDADGEALVACPTDEDSPLRPHSVYGITKLSQEALTLNVARGLGLSATALRFQNVYGPGQSLSNPYTGILSIFASLILVGGSIDIFEDGRESRDFVYIDDAVDAIVLALDPAAGVGVPINVGTGVATSVNGVVDELEAAFGVSVTRRISGSFRAGDIRHNFADTSRAEELLRFSARTSFESGVRRFVDWVRSQPATTDRYGASLDEMRRKGLLK